MDDFRERCRSAGIGEDKPLFGILATVLEAAETAKDAARDGARGITPEGEAELVRRVAKSAEIYVAKSVARAGKLVAWRTGSIVGVIVATMSMSAGIGGYWWGRSSIQAEILAQCSRYTVTLDDGRKACAVPLSPKR